MNKGQPCVRFAPSPTGFIHLGNARTALLNWLFARKIGARFILRLDDTDHKRSEERFTQALLEDLVWLGLAYDAFVRQSERTALYEEKIDFLKNSGRLYPCYETPQELEVKRKLQLSRGQPPIYDREGLHLSEQRRQQKETEGRKPHWRFLLKEGEAAWEDLMRGSLRYDVRTVSDPIVVREDGTISFLLAGAVDDHDLGITHVLRGEDHITNTAVQIQILEALGYDSARLAFGHFSWITDAQGQGFSKRLGSLSLQDLRAQGMIPLALSSFLAALGTAEAPRMLKSLDELVLSFDLQKFGRATPKLDVKEVWNLHTKFLHQLSYAEVLPLLKAQKIEGVTPELWHVVRESLLRLEDIEHWKTVCQGLSLTETASAAEGQSNLAPLSETFLQTARETLPLEPWSEDTWGEWTQRLKAVTGLSGKNLYHPLRERLTGLSVGPEMKKLLPLLKRPVVLERLEGTA